MMELLSKYVEFKNGKKRPTSKGTIPVYGGNGILDYTNTANMQSGVVIGRVGVYCGSVFLVREECWVSDNAIKAMCKENIDLGYLYYLLSSLHLNERRIGTSQPLLTQNILNNIEVEIPELAIQKKISSILELLDEKIKLNNEINKNLEEQAATLFSENYFNRNYNVSKLEDIATIKYGKELPTKKLTPKGFPVFGGNGVIGKYIHFMYDEPQILVSCRGAASGNIIETYPNSFVTNNSLVLEWNDYRYYEFYKQFLFANPLHTYATGSAQPQITIDNIKNVPFPCPKYDEIRELCSQLKSISALHFENIVESNKLSMLRDTLLPKLISGELDVSNLDI
ncbi:MAG: restriction endonuclease subunit S [Lactobacillus iners]|nr:restriction endonuclease subunit S [Lactobacillus iners]MCT7847225.1 restriction endonuclease subunit S [Lactobacillus iners]